MSSVNASTPRPPRFGPSGTRKAPPTFHRPSLVRCPRKLSLLVASLRSSVRIAYAQYCAAVAARADQQHNWVMQGDHRGVYGIDGATLMRVIRRR